VALALAATSPLAAAQLLRLSRGAHRDPRTAGNVAFWASTQVALAMLATTVGVAAAALLSPALSPQKARELACLLLVPMAYLGVLVVQLTSAGLRTPR
jgi:hypothetical protein